MWEKQLNVARPRDINLRMAILSVFDNKPISTIRDVQNFLKKGNSTQDYQSTRRMLIKMTQEGLIKELPDRGAKNQIFYVKDIFSNVSRLTSYDGNAVALHEFITELVEEVNPPLIDSIAMDTVKYWILSSLASSFPEPYIAKGHDVPDKAAFKEKLEGVLSMTRKFHAYLKSFLDADVWSPVAEDRLSREFQSTLSETHSAIVDRSWMDNAKQDGPVP